jgi:hypothetical protein
MNNKIFTFLILIFCANISFAQKHICGVTQDDQAEMISFIENFNKTSDLSSVRSVDPIYVPVKFHMVSENDGSGRIKADAVMDQMAVLIEAYKELGIYLYLQDARFIYLNSTSIYYNPGNFVNTIVNNKDNDAINIFICENANPPGSADDAGVVLGFYNPDGDYIIIRNNDVQNATSSLTHEVGHLFALPHTFFGWENVYAHFGWVSAQGQVQMWDVDQFNGMYNSTTCGGSNVLAEVMDQSNCTASADRICDTPPDYNFGFGAGGTCAWNKTLRDINGDVIVTQENNIMSYFSGCDEYVFTEGQTAVMVANYNSSAREHIRSDYIPDTTEIIDNHELIYPAKSEKLEYYNNILLDWSDADGASNYLLTVNSSTGEFFEFFTEDSEFFLEELSPNTFYFWDVRPYNEGNTSIDGKNSFFTTGSDLDTGVKESNLIQNVNVFPNPSRTGQDINVAITMETRMKVTSSIIDLTGKVVNSKTQVLEQGNNALRIESILESGIYILKLDTEDGSIHKKIIIQ